MKHPLLNVFYLCYHQPIQATLVSPLNLFTMNTIVPPSTYPVYLLLTIQSALINPFTSFSTPIPPTIYPSYLLSNSLLYNEAPSPPIKSILINALSLFVINTSIPPATYPAHLLSNSLPLNKAPSFALQAEPALIYDSVHVFALGLQALERSTTLRVANLSCDHELPWSDGSSLFNYINSVGSPDYHFFLRVRLFFSIIIFYCVCVSLFY